jgi:hypothetical protein
MFARPGARALQARMVEVQNTLSLLIIYMRACKARAPSHSTVFLFRNVLRTLFLFPIHRLVRRMFARPGARALQARMVELPNTWSLLIIYMRALQARAPSHSATFFLFQMYRYYL